MNGRAFWSRRVWRREGLAGTLAHFVAQPLSLGYSCAVRARNALYSVGLLPTKALPRPVVSIGNLTVGGSGKTPTAVWLAQQLERRGYRVATLTRGYGRRARAVVILDGGRPGGSGAIDVEAAGDEAWMMASLFGQKVAVARRRYEAGRRLLESCDVDIFLLDDGYQHRQLKRDIDVLLLGEEHGTAFLPAGPLREPLGAIDRADFVLVTGAREKWRAVLERRGRADRVFFATAEPKCLRSWEGDRWREWPLARLAGAKVIAVCGVARPEAFYRMLTEWEAEIVDVVEFDDHHSYSGRDWQRVNRASQKANLVVTTEKDIVKLLRFPFAKGRLAALRLEMAVERGDELVEKIARLIGARLTRR
ncbi:MAG TPA: tetraacyldisaccharide 4'-kinase [Candidatus Acidoferrales bacterium]|nr:tetraacyldisaccharide 4'-kinase [Candidatus Acidoferrales bacterium]